MNRLMKYVLLLSLLLFCGTTATATAKHHSKRSHHSHRHTSLGIHFNMIQSIIQTPTPVMTPVVTPSVVAVTPSYVIAQPVVPRTYYYVSPPVSYTQQNVYLQTPSMSFSYWRG